jgi:hypothetical protein
MAFLYESSAAPPFRQAPAQEQRPHAYITLNNGLVHTVPCVGAIGTRGLGVNPLSMVDVCADEVSLESPNVDALQHFDLARAEVLIAPQDTPYGRNATGRTESGSSPRPTTPCERSDRGCTFQL